VVTHVEDDLRRGLTLCGLPQEGRDTRRFPLPSESVITCPDCLRAIRECMNEGNPP
jgi:hypothetical protein